MRPGSSSFSRRKWKQKSVHGDQSSQSTNNLRRHAKCLQKVTSRLSGLSFQLKLTSVQVFKPNKQLFSVIKQTLISCFCVRVRSEWPNAVLSERACAAGDKLFWSGLELYLQSRWLVWFKIAPPQLGCRWKTLSAQGPAKSRALTTPLYALRTPQNSIFELDNSFGSTSKGKTLKK